MTSLVQRLVSLFGVVVLDTPPLGPVADAAVLAPNVDGVLLVVAKGVARREAVKSAAEQLQDLGVHSLGVVVNKAEQNPTYGSYYPRRVRVNGRSNGNPS